MFDTSKKVDKEAKQAAYLRLALQLGVKSVSDVVRWADSQIISTEQPAEPLLDLSLMFDSHLLDVMGKLGKLSGAVTALDVVETVLADAHASLLDDRGFGRSLARNLYSFYVENGYPSGLDECVVLGDEYGLADQGIRTEEDAYRCILDYTGSFVVRRWNHR